MEKLYRMKSHTFSHNGNTYTFFMDGSTHKSKNTIASDLLGYDVGGSIIMVKRVGTSYVSPSSHEVASLVGGQIIHRDECMIL